MNLLEGGKGSREGGGERVGERGWGGDGRRVGEIWWGGDVGERGRMGEGREGRGGGMFNSNPMIPQYLNNNLT